jgi:hypothetical protein
MRHADADQLALAALGEVPDDDAHIADCAECRAEVRSLREVVDLARAGQAELDLPPVPGHVWDGVAAAVAQPPTRRHAPPRSPMTRPRPRRRAGGHLLAAAAAAGVVLGLGTAAVVATSPQPAVVAQAELDPQPGTPVAARGSVQIVESDGRLTARVAMAGLPPHDGVYEVWLYDGDRTMIPIGVTSGSTVELPIPETIDLAAYPVVDVSAQRLGQQEHGTSVLQGRVPD